MKNENLSKKELEAKAVDIFKARREDKLFATSDGQFFVDKSRANMHAGWQRKTPLKVYEIEREEKAAKVEAPVEPVEHEKNAKDTIADVKEMSDVAELESLKEKNADRKTVIAAIDKRITELAEAEEAAKNDNPKTDD